MELVTQISMRSKRASTVTAKVATAAESDGGCHARRWRRERLRLRVPPRRPVPVP